LLRAQAAMEKILEEISLEELVNNLAKQIEQGKQ
jgi:DNA-binding IscR family transcriptional regulator